MPPIWARPISWANNHTPSNIAGFGPLPYTPLIPNHRTRFGASLGGPLLRMKFLGDKWFFFLNNEALRFPNVGVTEFTVPSPLFRAGVIQVPDASGNYIPYNLSPTPVTVGGVTYQPATCPNSPNGLCDPRGLGLNPVVNQIWTKFMPLPNDPTGGDKYNTQGWITGIRAPLTQNKLRGADRSRIQRQVALYGRLPVLEDHQSDHEPVSHRRGREEGSSD